MIIIPKKKVEKITFKDTLGYMPERLARKSYMQVYHNHYDYHVITEPGMGFFKVKIGGSVGRVFRNVGKFLSKAAKDVGQIAKPVMKVIKDVGEVTEDAYDAAKKVAIKALPPGMRGYVSDALMVLEKTVTNPVATVRMITESAAEIAQNIVREAGKPLEVVYKQAVRPGFRIVRNVANETVWKPVHKVVDVAVLPILPKSVRDKVDEILDIPEKTFSGKLTDKELVDGLKAVYQVGMIPTKIVGKFTNDTINTLKKDAILGPFLETIDKYSGGVLTSAQNLTTLPDQIYHNKNIDWKKAIIDGLKVYLATISVNQLITSATTSYVGDETGLNKTPLGRTTLAASSLYGKAVYGGADWSSIVTAGDAAKSAALSTARSESITHAVKNGWVDDKKTASMILSASGKFYDTAGTDKTLINAMNEIHDHEFQKYMNEQIKKELGVPLTYAHLSDVYNADWQRMANDVMDSMKKMVPVVGTTDGQFLERMGQNFVDEMKRLPGNFSNISDDVLKEVQKTPENLMKLASNVASEASRTPENIATIAENIARESARAVSNVSTEAVKAPEVIADTGANIVRESDVFISNVVDEVTRTPENISEIADNISRETGVAVDNIIKEGSKVNYEDLLKKYGPTLAQFLSLKYPDFNPATQEIPDYIYDDIEYNLINFDPNAGKKSNTPLFAMGLVGALALAYLAQDD